MLLSDAWAASSIFLPTSAASTSLSKANGLVPVAISISGTTTPLWPVVSPYMRMLTVALIGSTPVTTQRLVVPSFSATSMPMSRRTMSPLPGWISTSSFASSAALAWKCGLLASVVLAFSICARRRRAAAVSRFFMPRMLRVSDWKRMNCSLASTRFSAVKRSMAAFLSFSSFSRASSGLADMAISKSSRLMTPSRARFSTRSPPFHSSSCQSRLARIDW